MGTARTGKGQRSRRKSRELALKGLYSFLHGNAVDAVLRDLREDEDFARADGEYFDHLLREVSAAMTTLDARIAPLLDRPVAELSPVEHAVLCLSGYELIHAPEIPYRVVINEGVELAKSYGGTDGYKFVNGVLDRLAAETRGGEFVPRGKRS